MTLGPIAITMGDPAGIGPEIIAKLFVDPARPRITLLVIGNMDALRRGAIAAKVGLEIQEVSVPGAAVNLPNCVSLLQVGPALPPHFAVGRVDATAGAAAYAYLEKAIDLALADEISAIVTAPINKESFAAAGIPYAGHTEILAHRARAQDFTMMLVNDELKVILVSIHLSLANAIAAVTIDNELRAIRLAHQACLDFGIVRPRIAVAGLNPHAGENGMFGKEDQNVIVPAIAQARREGMEVSGPWPGDTVFMRARRNDFDIVVAQYHDQGLIPVKYLGVDQGVNVTVGLPFVRTSVDHGTAFDIAGSGLASHASLLRALETATTLAAGARTEAQESLNDGC